MLQFLTENAANIVICLVLAALLALAVAYRVRKRRRGEFCDCGGCDVEASCPYCLPQTHGNSNK